MELEGVDDLAAAAEMVRSHPATTSEIRILCGDLQVLGRSEFKQLLKWRLLLKKDMKKTAADAAAAENKKAKKSRKEGDSSGEEEEEELDEDGLPVEKKDKATQLEEQLLEEMSEIKDRMDRRKKREKRRRRELKIKSRVRAAQLAQSEGIGEEDTAGPDGLFSLASLKTRKGGVDGVADAAAPSDEDAALSSDDEDSSSESDIDSDEERLRYDATMDEYLEESYRSWKVRQRMKGAGGGVEKKRRRRLGMDGELDDEEEEEEEKDSGSEEEESEQEEEVEEEEGGGLIVSLDERRVGRAAGAVAAANQWFSQELFDDADLEDDEEEELEDLHPAKRRAAASNKINSTKPVVAAAAAAASDSEEEEEEEESGDEEAPAAPKTSGKSKANGYGFSAADRVIPDSGMTAAAAANAALKRERAGFEEVPMSDSDDGSDSGAEEFEALDDDQKAEVRALAKKFLRKKSKDDIMEAAYNRYAFHDDNLPKWFVEDENKYMRPAPQITAEEYKAAKEEMRAIDARPIRKVVEAKARKRKRMQAKLTQARQKAESIANQEDVPMKAKMREIEKLYAKARATGSKSKKPGGGSRSDQYKKKKGPPLDARMRKDKRGMDAAVRRNKAKGRAPPKGAKAGGGKGGKGGRR